MLRELREIQQQTESRIQDPLSLLKQQPLKSVTMLGSVKTRIAPSYLTHTYHKNKNLALYFQNLFQSKGLLKSALYGEIGRLASSIDNMLYDDSFEVFNSLAVERMCRRLYGCELALLEVTSQNTLHKADWSLADELDLNTVEGAGYMPVGALEEVDKRLERRAKTAKYLGAAKDRSGPEKPERPK